MSGNFSVISLFSGCGGSSLGYHMAGGNVLCAVEMNKHAAANYSQNFPRTHIFVDDICNVSADAILNASGLGVGELDILDGSPPCQGFSMCGSHNPDNPKNRLYLEYIRLLRSISPRVFVMENVGGMRKGVMVPLYNEILHALRSSGYLVFVKLLNSKNYGVAQSRNRLFFIGIRDDLSSDRFEFPFTVYPPPSDIIIPSEDVLRNVPPADMHYISNDEALRLWNLTHPGEKFGKYHEKSFFNCYKLDPHSPAPTIPATVMMQGRSGLFHWECPRFMTIPEIKRLQSFPDDFKLAGGFVREWACIGNSVPPLMMRAVADHVNNSIIQEN